MPKLTVKKTTLEFRPPGALALSPAAWGHEFEIALSVDASPPPPPFNLMGDVAVVTIDGPLVHHDHPHWDSYDAIARRVDAAFDCAESKAVAMKINSPGGDVDGCFDLARSLRAMSETHGKPLMAYADGMAASAAYAIASAANFIAVPQTGFVGSIGIIEALVDQTMNDAMQGFRFVMVTSGTRKADGNPHVPITKDSTNALQGQVDGLAQIFFALVEDHRGLPAPKVAAMQAAMFFGERAVSAGLADAVCTFGELISRASNPKAETKMPKFLDMVEKAMSEGEDEGEKRHMKEAYKAYLKSKAKGLEEDGEGDEGAPPEKKKEAKAEDESEGEGKKAIAATASGAKAEDEDEGKKMQAKKAEDESEGKKAFAAANRALAAARSALIATRPDFDKATRDMLSAWPVEQVAEACAMLPRAAPIAAVPNPVVPAATRGAAQSEEGAKATAALAVPKEESNYIAKKMGLAPGGSGIKYTGQHLELGFMTPAQAAAHVAKLDAAQAKEGN